MIKFDRQKDRVRIVAPASAIRDEDGRFDAKNSMSKLQVAMSLFEAQGLKCQYDKEIFSNNSLDYFSATKEERLRQFKEALEAPEVKIISAFRGGYGSSEIVFDCLGIKPSGPKILVGFSDITVLHFLFNQHYNFPSIHGLVNETYANMMGEFISVLEGKATDLVLEKVNESAKSANDISGVVTGGNLSLICNMIGTKLHPDTKDKILIMEDIGEKGYKIHRYLLHMYNAGLFKDVSAVVFADFVDSDNYLDVSIDDFIANYLQTVPVFKTHNIGHGKVNYPFAMGAMGKIANNRLSIESPFQLV